MKKIAKFLPRLFPPLLGAAIGVLVTAGCIRLSEAHAAAAVALAAAADPSPAPVSIDWAFWAGLLVAAGTFASLVLHAVANKTHNAKVIKLADEIDVLRGMVRGLIPVVGVPTSVTTTAAAPTSTTPGPVLVKGSGTALVVLLLLGALAAPALTGCATGKAAAAAGTVAFLECEDGHLDATALADFKAAAANELRHIFGGAAPDTAALKLELSGVKSDLGKCAWAGAVAAVSALVPSSIPGTAVSALVAAGPDPVQVRTAFTVAVRPLGWAPMRMADGTVL